MRESQNESQPECQHDHMRESQDENQPECIAESQPYNSTKKSTKKSTRQ